MAETTLIRLLLIFMHASWILGILLALLLGFAWGYGQCLKDESKKGDKNGDN